MARARAVGRSNVAMATVKSATFSIKIALALSYLFQFGVLSLVADCHKSPHKRQSMAPNRDFVSPIEKPRWRAMHAEPDLSATAQWHHRIVDHSPQRVDAAPVSNPF